MKIYPVSHGPRRNRYCGPAALSIMTGRTTDECAANIRHLTGRRAVMMTDIGELVAVAAGMGVMLFHRHSFPNRGCPGRRPTLAAWLRESRNVRTAGRVYLVLAGRHWQVITGRRYCCCLTKEIVSIRDKRVRRRARVEMVYEAGRVA